MLDVVLLTEENIKEVARLTARSEAAVRADFNAAKENNQVLKVWVDVPDIPEGFMRTN